MIIDRLHILAIKFTFTEYDCQVGYYAEVIIVLFISPI